MKVTVILGPFLGIPPEHCGAVEKLWLNLCRAFARSGVDVQLVVRSGAGKDDDRKEPFAIERVRSVAKSGRLLQDLVADFLYSAKAAARTRAADVTVVNSFWLPVLAPMRRRLGRIVYNVQRMPKRQFVLYGAVDLFAIVSNAVRDAVMRQAPRLAPKTIVIGNAVATGVFAFQARPAASSRILYVGRVHPEKGLDLLIAAMRTVAKENADAELLIVGPHRTEEGGGGDAYLERLRAQAHDLPIVFAPPVYDDTQLARTLATAAVFAYPSIADRGDAFPVAVLEAMSCGAVPVVSGLRVFDDYVKAGENGFVFDHHATGAASQLAERLLTALALPEQKRERMRLAARTAACRFSVEAIAAQYLDAFSRLVS